MLIGVALLPAIVAGQGQTPPAPTPAGASAPPLPWVATVEGQPIDTRPTEKKDNAPAFREQTRAPYHATSRIKVTPLIENLHAPWSLAFLQNGEILVTERLPGRMRILDTHGVVSEPLAGVAQSAFITASALFLVIQAVNRIIAPEPIDHSLEALVVMCIAITCAIGLIVYERRVVAKSKRMGGPDEIYIDPTRVIDYEAIYVNK